MIFDKVQQVQKLKAYSNYQNEIIYLDFTEIYYNILSSKLLQEKFNKNYVSTQYSESKEIYIDEFEKGFKYQNNNGTQYVSNDSTIYVFDEF